MSQLSTMPVIRCSHCGRPIIVTHLSTAESDYNGEQLNKLLQNMGRNALCPACQRSYNYYASQGRTEDWRMGRP